MNFRATRLVFAHLRHFGSGSYKISAVIGRQSFKAAYSDDCSFPPFQ